MLGKAKLTGFSFAFEKQSNDGSAKCNVKKTKRSEDVVWGVLFSIRDCEMKSLRKKEGGYKLEIVEVVYKSRHVCSTIIIALDKRVNVNLRPYNWYKRLVEVGATRAGIEENYIKEFITSVESVEDENEVNNNRAEVAIQDRTT